jgi:5-methyltetrahydrofolate--homocysteine methyltransferase
MPLIVNELQRRRLSFPVLIGGAAINRRFGRRILLTEQETYYEPGVYYCKDAFEGLAVMESLAEPAERSRLAAQIHTEADLELGRAAAGRPAAVQAVRSSVGAAPAIPTAPSWGPRVVHSLPLDAVFACLDENTLFRLSWGAKNTHGEDWTRLEAEFKTRLEAMRRQALQEGWLKPQGAYGYWPAQADGDDLVIFEPGSLGSGAAAELVRFAFPRQPDGERLCLADYFLPLGSQAMDVVAFQVVTVGAEATARFDRLQGAASYSEAYFTHGLGVQTAEAAAEFLHRHIRRELGLAPNAGKRYSWGYPAIPELADHAKVFSLLPVESELGMSLTSAFQLLPEQSTAAIILHHPQAVYFNIGESRIEQLTRKK